MMRLVRWLLASQPRFRPYDGCDPSDLAIVRGLADLIDAREAADPEHASQNNLPC